jgi:hypothetical protein
MSQIYGIGTDICDIRRIRASFERHGERFALKILSEAEMHTFRARSLRWPDRGIRFLATRFSVKEAFSKAIGLGMRMPMTWRHCPPSFCMALYRIGSTNGDCAPMSPSATKPTTPPATSSLNKLLLEP